MPREAPHTARSSAWSALSLVAALAMWLAVFMLLKIILGIARDGAIPNHPPAWMWLVASAGASAGTTIAISSMTRRWVVLSVVGTAGGLLLLVLWNVDYTAILRVVVFGGVGGLLVGGPVALLRSSRAAGVTSDEGPPAIRST